MFNSCVSLPEARLFDGWIMCHGWNHDKSEWMNRLNGWCMDVFGMDDGWFYDLLRLCVSQEWSMFVFISFKVSNKHDPYGSIWWLTWWWLIVHDSSWVTIMMLVGVGGGVQTESTRVGNLHALPEIWNICAFWHSRTVKPHIVLLCFTAPLRAQVSLGETLGWIPKHTLW